MSHLLQMRGLKPKTEYRSNRQDRVASFTDAWIETFAHIRTKDADNVASFTDAWIETSEVIQRL